MVRAILFFCAVSSASGFVSHTGCVRTHQLHTVCNMSPQEEAAGHCDPIMTGNNISRRRALLLTTIALPSFWASHARPSFAAKLRPDDAYASLVKARQELQVASDRYLPKKDWEGLRTYLTDEAVNMNNYDVSAQALLESKRLDAESKKDIGTIRRYGVGADVIIMYGGLKNEVDEGNESVSYAEVGKFLRGASQSLEEVLAICRSNGFN
mmetsp:Transcript_24505/g.40173  ORF Transcript_24505/g.40173 Transcript_24505/m.40173 type:complete len:210 (-) Transcript_24505:99-728(-)